MNRTRLLCHSFAAAGIEFSHSEKTSIEYRRSGRRHPRQAVITWLSAVGADEEVFHTATRASNWGARRRQSVARRRFPNFDAYFGSRSRRTRRGASPCRGRSCPCSTAAPTSRGGIERSRQPVRRAGGPGGSRVGTVAPTAPALADASSRSESPGCRCRCCGQLRLADGERLFAVAAP
jgi:hypothetical protein